MKQGQNNETIQLIEKHFSQIEDPRGLQGRRHKFTDIMAISILAMICGSDEWTEIEEYGKCKRDFLEEILELPNGIPSHDTFGRVFSIIEPSSFEKYFRLWVNDLCEMCGELVNFDGKTLRRSYSTDDDKAAIHMVSAWANANNMVLGQVKVEDKSNEITAIPRLLEMLDLSGATVTIDAMGCQTEIAEGIINNGADYILAVKGNQGDLYEEITESFEKVGGTNQAQSHTTENKGHGRLEQRTAYALAAEQWLSSEIMSKWMALQTIVKIETNTTFMNGKKKGQTRQETRYYISSLRPDSAWHNILIRNHWGIENKLHWVLDVAFREDDCRVRKGYAAQNMAILRHIALNKLKNEKSHKRGIKNKRKKAGWDDDYLLKVLIA